MLTNHTNTEEESLHAVKSARSRSEEIFRAAAEVITVKGFDATSMNDIAKAVDLTKAGLYHYIQGKQELLHAIMDYAMDAIEQEVVAPALEVSDPRERLRLIIWNHTHLLTNHGTHVSILTDEVSALTPAHRADIVQRKRVYLNFMRETLQQLKDSGQMRDLDVNVTSLNILATVVGMARWYNPEGPKSIHEIAEHTTSWVLNGVLADPS